MQTIQIDNGQTETYILDKYATLADRSVMQKIGGSVLLCSICVDYENPTTEDFVPLSVQYIEKMYAIGRIPQGYIKKEGKPSDTEILTSRLIDRSLRPLFPKGYPYPVQITILVMSYDGKTDVCQNAMNLASICLYLSSIPIVHDQILNAVRIVQHDEVLSVCDSIQSLGSSSLDLFVSGVGDCVTMIEMQAQKTTTQTPEGLQEHSNEIPQEKLLDAMKLARTHIAQCSKQYTTHFAPFVLPKREYKSDTSLLPLLKTTLQTQYGESIEQCLVSMSKTERHTQLHALIAHIANEQNLDESLAARHVFAIKKEIMRTKILKDGMRADGRNPTQIRHIDIESNILPHAHGSACFTRGQTQALVSCTLGNASDAQSQESIIAPRKSTLLFHYNFPPFSVGEAYPIGQSSRRELGHGNLALKAIESNIAQTPHTIRLVSEILQSNGSSSMASVCGATLAMLGAGVRLHNMVAGIAMGLVYEDDNNFVVLSDIMGLEDFDGDMDFKIAGNEKGFSALQLDIKISGLSEQVLQRSLQQASEGISHILSLMRAVEITPNYALLPQKESFQVPHGRIAEIIGQGGRVIRDIIARFQVHIDLDKDQSLVSITANNADSLQNAKAHIFEILRKNERKELPYKVGDICTGVVRKQLDVGFILDLEHGGSGLLRSMYMSESLGIGEQLRVSILSNNYGKIELKLPDSE